MKPPFTATYDEANRLTSITLNGETFTLDYDNNGNLASKSGPTSGTTTYSWTARNQLAAISGPAGNASFRYDALGRRIEKTANGNTTGFLYDGAQAIAELKGSALDTVYHTGFAIDEVLARYGASGNKTLLTDALMSVIAQGDDDQSTQNFYGYSPYGETQTLGPDGGNSLQYTGRENDGTGLYYYRARYYDPVLKRFISEDPIGTTAGLNFYAYANNNPGRFTDPFGLEVYVAGHVAASPVGQSASAVHLSIHMYSDSGTFVGSLGGQIGLPFNLVSTPNYPGDAPGNTSFQVPVLPPPGMSNADFISALQQAANSYGNNQTYNPLSCPLVRRASC